MCKTIIIGKKKNPTKKPLQSSDALGKELVVICPLLVWYSQLKTPSSVNRMIVLYSPLVHWFSGWISNSVGTFEKYRNELKATANAKLILPDITLY